MEEEVIILSRETIDHVKEYLPSNGVLSDMCAYFSVFSDVTRVKILIALSISELCVTDLAAILTMNQTTVSHQLKQLRDAGMVDYRREGKIIFYRTVNERINDIMMTGATHLGY